MEDLRHLPRQVARGGQVSVLIPRDLAGEVDVLGPGCRRDVVVAISGCASRVQQVHGHVNTPRWFGALGFGWDQPVHDPAASSSQW